MKIIKTLMVIVTILIICLIGFLVFNKVSQKQEEKKIETIGDAGEQIDYNVEETKQVTDAKSFYTVNKCVNQYLNAINKQNSSYYGEDENGNYELIFEEEEIKEKVYALLSEEYIEKNEIEIENVYDYVDNLKEQVFFVPLKMKYILKPQIEKYVVYGIEQNMDNEFLKEIYLVVNLDKQNKTFSIEPLREYDDIEEISIENDNRLIEENNENTYRDEQTSYEYILREYIDAYKKLALGNPEIAYNLLDEEYRNKRFGDLHTYKEYIENNKEEIKSIQGSQYLVNHYEGHTQYVCQDKYQNSYIFNEKSVMDFTLQLDSYTIPTENFIKTYNNEKEYKKVMLNVDKWVRMLNNRDYSSAYQILDETYRENNFKTEKEFEIFIKEKLPLYYKVQYTDFSEENGIYMQRIILTDITEENSEGILLSIVMQLKDDLNFVMAFSFPEE